MDLAAVRAPTEKQFLSYERRGLWGQCAYNIGYSYFSGILVGGTFGVLRGFHASPNMHPRVLLNSVLNGSGKFGARAGNAMGVLSLIYTGAWVLEGMRHAAGVCAMRALPSPAPLPLLCSRRAAGGGDGGRPPARTPGRCARP